MFDGIWLDSNENGAGRGITLRQSVVMIPSSAICRTTLLLTAYCCRIVNETSEHSEPINVRQKPARHWAEALDAQQCASCRHLHTVPSPRGCHPLTSPLCLVWDPPCSAALDRDQDCKQPDAPAIGAALISLGWVSECSQTLSHTRALLQHGCSFRKILPPVSSLSCICQTPKSKEKLSWLSGKCKD